MAEIDRFTAVQKKLKDLKDKYEASSVTVGYTQAYAIYVHENLEANHKEGKQAKYLETPARLLAPELGRIASQVTQQTGNLEQGLLVAGLRLQRESQKIVPIDTSALKASAFTALTKDVEQASQNAYQKSEAAKERKLKIRAKKLKVKKNKRRRQ